MSILLEKRLNLFLMQEAQWMLTRPAGVSNYDFNFRQFFECQHPYQLPQSITVVPRIGAVDNYSDLYEALQNEGVTLIHAPEEHINCSELPFWYPVLSDLTPKSVWFDELPSLEQVTAVFDFPIFMKGSRQTSQHKRSLSIISSVEAFNQALKYYVSDPILHWQNIVRREYVDLKPVQDADPDTIPASYEFRAFWWKKEFVGAGPYWFQANSYEWSNEEKQEALAVAGEAAKRIPVTFLVVDVAQRTDGEWIVIECNDGQESGYAGLSPIKLWENIIAVEKSGYSPESFE